MKLLVVVTFFLSFLLMSCGGYNTGIIQKSENGFIKLTGNTVGVSLSVDDGGRFTKDTEVDLIEIKPGKHTIKIYRDDILRVNRIIIVENQNIVEIEVP